MNANFALTLFRRPRISRESLIRGLAELRAAGRRASGSARREAPSRRYRLPPTRAARSSRSRGVFFAPGKRMLSVVFLAAALFALAATLGTAKVVDSATFNANAGPRLVASASLAPPAILVLRR
ncbi:MAG: hypothetical protein ABI900_00770 [Betaproteobacteria bacterium]